MIENKPKYSFSEAKLKLEAYCAYQERCSYEVLQKLRTWNVHPEDHDILIADLIANNFLNEERFAEAYASGKFNLKKWGKVKIKNQLKVRQISNYSIEKALGKIGDNVYESTLEALAQKKWDQLRGNSWEKLGKLKRYLYLKGYESDLVNSIVQSYLEKR